MSDLHPMTSIAELLDRVRAATGPDWKLDGDLHVTLAGSEPTRDRKAPPYTASVDAALALVERKLPGWGCQVGHPIETHSVGWYASVFLDGRHFFHDWVGEHIRPPDSYRPNGALAILAALLSALSNEVNHDDR